MYGLRTPVDLSGGRPASWLVGECIAVWYLIKVHLPHNRSRSQIVVAINVLPSLSSSAPFLCCMDPLTSRRSKKQYESKTARVKNAENTCMSMHKISVMSVVVKRRRGDQQFNFQDAGRCLAISGTSAVVHSVQRWSEVRTPRHCSLFRPIPRP